MAQILPFTREPIAFDPEIVALAISAYDKVIVEFRSAPPVVREVIAKHIIQLIAQGERDPEVLYQRALVAAGVPI